MLYLITSFVYLIISNNKHSLSKYLFFLLLMSSIGAFLVGRQHSWDINDLFYTLYIYVLLVLMFLGYNKYSNVNKSNFTEINQNKLIYVEKLSSSIGVLIIAIDLYILYKILGFLTGEIINVQEFKNEGGAADVFATIVPHFMITLGNLFCPLGYFFLSMHFFYIVHNNRKKSILFLSLSVCLVLNGLITLSRSVTVEYILNYIGLLYFFYPLLEKNLRKKLLKYIVTGGAAIAFLLFTISSSRFSNFYTKQSKNNAILDENKTPLLFSTVDYFSLWQENSVVFMQKRKEDQIYYGMYDMAALYNQVRRFIYGSPKVNEELEKNIFSKLDETYTGFHAPMAKCIYDLGYVGTIIYFIICFAVISYFAPRNKTLRFKTLISLPLLLPFGVLFFTGNGLGNLYVQIGIVYNIIIYNFVTYKKQGSNDLLRHK